MPLGQLPAKAREWFEQRLPLESFWHFFAKKTVPIHRHTIWYYTGGMTLLFFMIQVVTGILLLIYYRPTPEEAYESVRFIMTDVHFGWLIRSLHSWSANLMILFALIHLFATFFMQAYRPPRELTWLSGALLLFLSMAFGFSGYLLPWNTLALFATKVGTNIPGAMPFIGPFIKRVLLGGDQVSGASLTRFFGFHVAILPMCALAVLGIHLLMVQLQGMSVPPSQEKKQLPQMPFFPNFALRDLVGWLVALAVLVLLAALRPWEMGLKADPFAPAPAGIKPEWYFTFMSQTFKLFPGQIGSFHQGELVPILGFGFCALLLVLVPFLDRASARGKVSIGFRIAGILALIYMVIMTLLAYTT